jgi:hypothetical protein
MVDFHLAKQTILLVKNRLQNGQIITDKIHLLKLYKQH